MAKQGKNGKIHVLEPNKSQCGQGDLCLNRNAAGRPPPSRAGPRIRKEENRQWCDGRLTPGKATNQYLGMEKGGAGALLPQGRKYIRSNASEASGERYKSRREFC